MSSANLSNSSQFEIASSAAAAEAKSRYYAKPAKGRQDVSVAVKVAMFTVAIIGLALSSYLGWASFTSSKIVGCGSGQIFDCGHVMQTKWSSAFGIPVGIPAAGLYLTLLGSLAVFRWPSQIRLGRLPRPWSQLALLWPESQQFGLSHCKCSSLSTCVSTVSLHMLAD